MLDLIILLFATSVMLAGIPVGNALAKYTKEELASGQKWFKIVCAVAIAGGLWGAIVRNDALMFGLFFIGIVASRNLKKKE